MQRLTGDISRTFDTINNLDTRIILDSDVKYLLDTRIMNMRLELESFHALGSMVVGLNEQDTVDGMKILIQISEAVQNLQNRVQGLIEDIQFEHTKTPEDNEAEMDITRDEMDTLVKLLDSGYIFEEAQRMIQPFTHDKMKKLRQKVLSRAG